ncbi:MAG: WG repeat-containing protein [Eubacteriales bacterium]|nr:WG repeat-containing protein [Eubacteriales bacterium]
MLIGNKKHRIVYIIDHVFWAAIARLWYNSIFFKSLGDLSLRTSAGILLALLALFSITGMSLGIKRHRNKADLYVNVATGFGVYTVLAYLPIRKKLIVTVLAAAAVLSAAYAALVLCRAITNRQNAKKIIFRRIRMAAYGSRTILCVSMTVIMALIASNLFFGNRLFLPSVSPSAPSSVQDQTIENNIETLVHLDDGTWETLTVQEKLDVLQTVANIEQRYLGIPHELNVGASNLPEDVAGSYRDITHEIQVDLDCLIHETPRLLVETITHEAYHAFEHRTVDAYREASKQMKPLRLYQDARHYEDEFMDYESGNDVESFWKYYFQACESDAREYASGAAESYFVAVARHLGTVPDLPVVCLFYDEDGKAFLKDVKQDSVIAGPYLFIEEPFSKTTDAYRVIDDNGLVGYLDSYGKEIVPPHYLEGSRMRNGIALVRENPESVYYINSAGERLTQDLLEGDAFDNGSGFLRAKTEDGKWTLINLAGQTVFSGADRIEGIYGEQRTGSAVVNGHAVLLQINFSPAGNTCSISREFEEYTDISILYKGKYAIVTDASGNRGLIDNDGRVVLPAEYKSIECVDILYDCDDEDRMIRFRLEHEDGTTEIFARMIPPEAL